MRIDRVELVAQLRRHDMTQKELAAASGVSRETINYIANGKRCNDETAKKIARALNVPVEELTETR